LTIVFNNFSGFSTCFLNVLFFRGVWGDRQGILFRLLLEEYVNKESQPEGSPCDRDCKFQDWCNFQEQWVAIVPGEPLSGMKFNNSLRSVHAIFCTLEEGIE
jgi:hypothetical protein